jgi:hypothetical protein
MNPYALDNYNRRPLKKADIEDLVTPNANDPLWFQQQYQSRTRKQHPKPYKLETLIAAIHNSESLTQQFEIDDKRMNQLADSIFVSQGWLHIDPIVALIRGQQYIVGGRHRITAILNVLAQAAQNNDNSKQWQEVQWEKYLRFYVRVEEIYLDSVDDLIVMIEADNSSRRMGGAEMTSINTQQAGGTVNQPDTVWSAVADASTNDKVRLGAAFFIWQPPNSIPPEARKEIGRAVAKYVLFGDVKSITKKSRVVVQSGNEFDKWMTRAWEILNEEHKTVGKITPTTKKLLTEKVINQLRLERPLVTVFRAV